MTAHRQWCSNVTPHSPCSSSGSQGAGPKEPRIQGFRADWVVLRLMKLVSQGLFLRSTESPKFLELTEQLRDKRLRKKQRSRSRDEIKLWGHTHHSALPSLHLTPWPQSQGRGEGPRTKPSSSLAAGPLGLLLPPDQQSIPYLCGAGAVLEKSLVEESKEWVPEPHHFFHKSPVFQEFSPLNWFSPQWMGKQNLGSWVPLGLSPASIPQPWVWGPSPILPPTEFSAPLWIVP